MIYRKAECASRTTVKRTLPSSRNLYCAGSFASFAAAGAGSGDVFAIVLVLAAVLAFASVLALFRNDLTAWSGGLRTAPFSATGALASPFASSAAPSGA